MERQFARTALLLGEDAIERLKNCRVAVFGIGGVGGYAVEALARSGVGALDLIDNDTVSESNLNRQIIALHSTIGQYKVDVAAARVRDINPSCEVKTYRTSPLKSFCPRPSENSIFHNTIMWWTRSTPFRASWHWRFTLRRRACR